MWCPSFPRGTVWGIALLLSTTAALPARAEFTAQFKPSLEIHRAEGKINIDGDLDDPGWKNAAVADHFAEVNPGDQVEPPVHSEAWVTYDDENLYVALIAGDDPSEIRVSLRDRDAIFTDDYFGIMLDTYGEQAWGYELFVNPYGIQGDLRMLTTGQEELAFDIVWESEGKVTESGYQVEIAVPFASLRFPDREEQTWRINFWRDHQRDIRRRYAWAAIDRDEPCFMCQWGSLTGMKNIKAGTNIEVITTLVGRQAGERVDFDDPSSDFDNENLDGEASLNLRYGLSSNSSTELALNPDFSQVESDAGQIDVNNTFALFYPEKRPFFQEGSDQYSTPINAIYTRSINDPSVAAKFAAQFGKTNLAYTFARDEHSPLIVPFEEQSQFVALEKSFSNIFRLRQTIKDDTYLGALVTDRRVDARGEGRLTSEGGGSGTVFSADGNIRLVQNLAFEFQAAASHTREPEGYDFEFSGPDSLGTFDGGKHTANLDGESFWGHGLYASLERGGRTWNADVDYWEYSPTFRTDNGFTTKNDYRQVNGWTGMTFRPNRDLLINWEPGVEIGRVWNMDGAFKDEWFRPYLYFELKGQTELNIARLWSGERFGGERLNGINRWVLTAENRPWSFAGFGARTTFGQLIYRDFDDPQLGDDFTLSLWGQLKPFQRLVIEPNWDYAQMRSRVDDSLLFKVYILRTRFHFNFSREWSLRLIVQYNDSNRRMDLEPLLTYRINPFTLFYVGVNGRYRNYLLDSATPGEPVSSNWEMTSRQLFAKFQYLFRF